jgi:multidrug resistance efflux pump
MSKLMIRFLAIIFSEDKNMRHKSTINTILLAIFLGGLALAGCSNLPGQATPTEQPGQVVDVQPVISATGKVVPAHWSQLSMSVPGVIEEILVQKGDLVKEDQVLVRLKGKEDIQAAIAAAKYEVAAAEKNLNDLNKNADDTRTVALEAISAATKDVRDAQYQLDNFTVPQTQSSYSTTEALDVMQKNLDEARTVFEPYKYYSENDSTRKDLKKKLDEAQADYNSAVKRLQYETDLAVAQANLAKGLKDYETWKDGPDPDEVKLAQVRLENAQSALAAAEAQLQDLELRAPFPGTISDIYVRKGEWVTPGQAILLIADLSGLQVETTDLNEIDAARVKVNNPVTLTFDALPGVEVKGTVESISPKSSEGSGVNYAVVIKMDELPALLRWGMTAFADIRVE